MSDYEKEYNEFWKDIVEKDGAVNIDQVKRELCDYSKMIKQVSIVFCHVTGDRISYPNTMAFEVCNVADDYYGEKEDLDDSEDEIKDLTLALSEYKILFAASTKRERELMDGIRAHKVSIDETVSSIGFGAVVCPEDIKLHKLLGEVEV
jgi:hypothetical protein